MTFPYVHQPGFGNQFPKCMLCGHPLQAAYDRCPNPGCDSNRGERWKEEMAKVLPKQAQEPEPALANAIQNLASAIVGLSQVVGATTHCQGDGIASVSAPVVFKEVRPSHERVVFTVSDLNACLGILGWTLAAADGVRVANQIQRWIDVEVNSQRREP